MKWDTLYLYLQINEEKFISIAYNSLFLFNEVLYKIISNILAQCVRITLQYNKFLENLKIIKKNIYKKKKIQF